MKIEVEEILLNSGWKPGRSVFNEVELPHDWTIFGTAEKILDEFGNLRLLSEGAGIAFARSSIEFRPILAAFEYAGFVEYEITLGKRLYPLGELNGGYGLLLVDEDGVIYHDSSVLYSIGSSISVAIENILLGMRYSDSKEFT